MSSAGVTHYLLRHRTNTTSHNGSMPPNAMTIIQDAIVHAAAGSLSTGVAPQPQIHVIDETLEPAYVGYVMCRPYYRGQDATAAISHLGSIAAAMCATDLVVAWEESDLRTSVLGGNPEDHPRGIAVLGAPSRPSSHTLLWHPFHYYTSDGTPEYPSNPALSIAWGQPSRNPEAPLPESVRSLLHSWRTPIPFGPNGIKRTLTEAVNDGYEIHLTKR